MRINIPLKSNKNNTDFYRYRKFIGDKMSLVKLPKLKDNKIYKTVITNLRFL